MSDAAIGREKMRSLFSTQFTRSGKHFSRLFSLMVAIVSILIIGLLVLAFGFGIGDSEAAEIVVDSSGAGDHDTLLPAIEATEAGDIILVEPGTYIVDNVGSSIPGGVTIRGSPTGDTDDVRFLFKNPGSFLLITGSDITLENVNFTTARTEYPPLFKLHGPRISLLNCSITQVPLQVTIDQCPDLTLSGNHLKGATISFLAPWGLYSYPESLRKDQIIEALDTLTGWTISDNTYNGLPFSFISGADSISFNDTTTIGGGLMLYSCSNVTIDGIPSDPSSSGLMLLDCENVMISDSSLTGESNVLTSWLSRNVTIRNSTLGSLDRNIPSIAYPSSPATGTSQISLYSEDLLVLHNTINIDISLIGDDHPTISHNTFKGPNGLTLGSVSYATVVNNSFESTGLGFLIEGSSINNRHFEHTISGNHVQGNPIIFLRNTSDTVVPSTPSQVVLVNCTNITISSIETEQVSQGALFIETSFSTISNSVMSNVSQGISLVGSDRNVFQNSIFEGCEEAFRCIDSNSNYVNVSSITNGTIWLAGESNVLTNVTLSYNTVGYMYTGVFLEGYATFIDSSVTGCRVGLKIEEGRLVMVRSTVWNNWNAIEVETVCSLHLTQCEITQNRGIGVVSRDPEQMKLFDCTVSQNREDGIHLGGRGSLITDSLIEQNGGHGIVITDGPVDITDCSLIDNGRSGIHASYVTSLLVDDCLIKDNKEGLTIEGSLNFHVRSGSFLFNSDTGIHTTDGSYGLVELTTISGSEFGVKMDTTSMELRECTIHENIAGLYVNRPIDEVTISNSSIFDNSGNGIRTPQGNAFQVIAAYNYWGAPEGPYHIETNDDSEGNSVGDEIMYSPWYVDDTFTTLRYLPEPEEEEETSDDLTISVLAFVFLILPLFFIRSVGKVDGPMGDGPIPRKRAGQSSAKESPSIAVPQKFAPLPTRALAAIIDGVLIFFILLLMFLSFVLLFEASDLFCGVVFLLYFFIPIYYFLLTEGRTGRTPGKSLVNIRLISMDGKPITLSQAARSAIPKGALYPIGNLFDAILGVQVLNKKTQQRNSQKLANLMVVPIKKKSLKYSVQEDGTEGKLGDGKGLLKKLEENGSLPSSKIAPSSPESTPSPLPDTVPLPSKPSGPEFEAFVDEYSRRLDEMKLIWLGEDNGDDPDVHPGGTDASGDPPPPSAHELLDSIIDPMEDERMRKTLESGREILLKVDGTLKLLRKAETRLNSMSLPLTEPTEPGEMPEDQLAGGELTPDQKLARERQMLLSDTLARIPDVETSLLNHGEEFLDLAFKLPENHAFDDFTAHMDQLQTELVSAMDIVESATDLIHS